MGHIKQGALKLEAAEAERPTVNQPLRFYHLPILKYSLYIRASHEDDQPKLMDIGGRMAFVHCNWGLPPTQYELENGALGERQLHNVFVEASSPEEAREIYIREHPAAQGPNPALAFNKRPGKKIRLMPICNHMKRLGDTILCPLNIHWSTKEPMSCIVMGDGTGAPPGCPIDEAL